MSLQNHKESIKTDIIPFFVLCYVPLVIFCEYNLYIENASYVNAYNISMEIRNINQLPSLFNVFDDFKTDLSS